VEEHESADEERQAEEGEGGVDRPCLLGQGKRRGRDEDAVSNQGKAAFAAAERAQAAAVDPPSLSEGGGEGGGEEGKQSQGEHRSDAESGGRKEEKGGGDLEQGDGQDERPSERGGSAEVAGPSRCLLDGGKLGRPGQGQDGSHEESGCQYERVHDGPSVAREAPILGPVATAAILTIGNELVCGDVVNTNGTWLARRLESLGLRVTQISALPDEVERVAAWVRAEIEVVDVVVVTGGLGGTPDDITREALAVAFAVPQEEVPSLAAELRARFPGDPEYAARWANLPAGARPLPNPLGGAPGFRIGPVYVLPGLPAEMEAMFETIAPELRQGAPIATWRRTYRTTESRIVAVLEETQSRYPGVLVGSYPSFQPEGSRVEVVVKSTDPEELAAATSWLERALAQALG